MIMKKTVLSIIAICALAAVSCQEIEPEFTATKTQTITLRAQIDPETKTTYGSDVTFGWSAGDAISLLVKNADNSYSFIELTTTDSGASADFTGTLLAGQTIQDIALYPASENHVYTNDGTETIQFYLPTSYDYTTHESVNLPMVARKSAGTYTFKPAGGALKVTYNNLPGNTVLDFQFASDNKLNGLMELTDDKLPTCSYDGAGVDAHAIVVKARTDASGNATIYYPMPPKTDNGYNRLRIMWDGTTTRLYNKQNNGAAYKIPIAVGQITRLKAISFSHSPATESDFTKAKAGLTKTASGEASWKRGMRLVKLAYDNDNIYGYIEVDLGKDNVTRMNYLCVAVDNDGVHEGQSTSWIFNNYKGYDNAFMGKIGTTGWDPQEMTEPKKYERGGSTDGFKFTNAAATTGFTGTGRIDGNVWKYTFTLDRAVAGIDALTSTEIGIALFQYNSSFSADYTVMQGRGGYSLDMSGEANIEIDGDFSDWSKVTASATGDDNLKEVKAFIKGDYIYFYQKLLASSVKKAYWTTNTYVFIDSDNNPETGASNSHMTGIDAYMYYYMTQDGGYYSGVNLGGQGVAWHTFTGVDGTSDASGNQSSTNWTVVKSGTCTCAGADGETYSEFEIQVPRSALGNVGAGAKRIGFSYSHGGFVLLNLSE